MVGADSGREAVDELPSSAAGGGLAGYDVVFSLPESRLNRQLERLHRAGKLPLRCDVERPDGTGLAAALPPPRFELAVDLQRPETNCANLVIPLAKGVLQRPGGPLDIGDCTVRLRVDLGLAPLSPDEIRRHEGIEPEVKEVLESYDPRYVGIRALYVDWARSARPENVDRARSELWPRVEEADYRLFVDLLVEFLVRLRAVSQNPYNIGFVPLEVRAPTAERGEASGAASQQLGVTAARSGVTCSFLLRKPDDPGPTGLVRYVSYLMTTGDRPLPEPRVPAPFAFLPHDLAGAGLLIWPEEYFFGTVVLPRVRAALRFDAVTRVPRAWRLSGEHAMDERRLDYGSEVFWLRGRERRSGTLTYENLEAHETYGRCLAIRLEGRTERSLEFRFEPDYRPENRLDGGLTWSAEVFLVALKNESVLRSRYPRWTVWYDDETDRWFEHVGVYGTPGTKAFAAEAKKIIGDLSGLRGLLEFAVWGSRTTFSLTAATDVAMKDPRVVDGYGGARNVWHTVTVTG